MLISQRHRLGKVSRRPIELPAPGQYGMMTYEHDGRQFIVVQIGQGGSIPGSLAAFSLPDDEAHD